MPKSHAKCRAREQERMKKTMKTTHQAFENTSGDSSYQ
jgi:hypothetical protein